MVTEAALRPFGEMELKAAQPKGYENIFGKVTEHTSSTSADCVQHGDSISVRLVER